jgi:hypothetical protein
MAEKEFLQWIKWDCDTWRDETAEIPGNVLKTYLRLSTYSRNNDSEPGELVSRIDVLRLIAADTAYNTWCHLVDLTSRFGIKDGNPLAELWLETEEGWKRVVKGGEYAQKVPQGRVKTRFAWVISMMEKRKLEQSIWAQNKRQYRSGKKTTEDNQQPKKTTEDIERQQKTETLSPLEKRREEKIPPIPPKGVFDGWFEEVFWKAYPRKTAKKKAKEAAKKAWAAADADAIMAGLERSKESDQWRRDGGRFVPHAATWLNQERWTDEAEPGKDEGGRMKDEGRGWAGKNQKSGAWLETINVALALSE